MTPSNMRSALSLATNALMLLLLAAVVLAVNLALALAHSPWLSLAFDVMAILVSKAVLSLPLSVALEGAADDGGDDPVEASFGPGSSAIEIAGESEAPMRWEPHLNVDGTPMFNGFDSYGNMYGITSGD